MMRRLKLMTVLAAGAATLAACISVLPEQPEPNALYNIPAPETEIALPVNIVILEPDAPRLLGGRSVTAIGQQGGLRVVSGVAWTDRATRLLQIAMINGFSSDGSGLALDDAAGVPAAGEVFWRVNDFSLSGDRGHCALQLTLLNGRTRQPVAQTTVEAYSQSTGKGPEARTRALAEAGSDCVEAGAVFLANAAKSLAPADD